MSKRVCDCYCLVQWLSPLASGADVSPGPNTFTSFLNVREKETENGDEVWNAKVRTKKYVCGTTTVNSQSDQNIPLAKNSYTKTRTRRRTISITWSGWTPTITFPWDPWSAWTRTLGPPYSEKQALNWGNLSPWCPDKSIPCP